MKSRRVVSIHGVPGHASLLGYSRHIPVPISAKPVFADNLILAHRIRQFAMEFHQNILISHRCLLFPTRVADVTLDPSS
jgi:hypothetical protein